MTDFSVVPLSNASFFALVDIDDHDRVSSYTWRANEFGYIFSDLPGFSRPVPMHRFLLRVVASADVVDHVNGVPWDNRRQNLRICTNRENTQNRTRYRFKKLSEGNGYLGVCRASGTHWRAQIAAGEQRGRYRASLSLGTYATPEQAARAYDKAALFHFGEFASLNFPERVREPLPQRILQKDHVRRSGGRHPMARLSEQQVADVRHRLSAGEAGAAIAESYGVSRATISRIKLGKLWRTP